MISLVTPAIIAVCLAAKILDISARKHKDLHILTLIAYTGNEPRDGKLCQASMEVAINEANVLPNFIPDYHVVPVFRDEGLLAMKTV